MDILPENGRDSTFPESASFRIRPRFVTLLAA
jgi:hypothetical protein